jgi:membrane protease YdiL (CAAX protease family)
MSNTRDIQPRDYGKGLYLLPFFVFALLILLRNSDTYAYLFELLPVLGRTIPYFCLSVLLLGVFMYRGGSLQQLGLCWPKIDKNKFALLKWIFLSALAILVLRIVVGVASGPLMEMLPPKVSRTSPLVDNLSLLIALLPAMWLVVVAEEVLIRGLLMRFLVSVLGDTTKGWLLAVLISAVIFGLGHIGKGPAGMIGSGLGGLVYGLGYVLFRKNLWPVILAHCTGNTIGFVSAYFDD